MEDRLSYLFTIYGEVYIGNIFHEFAFPNCKIVIQRSKLREFLGLTAKDKTEVRIKQLGWVVPINVIAEILDLPASDFEKFSPRIPSQTINLTYDRSIMFIVGAGASAHCVFGDQKELFLSDPLRPPCGPELFQSRFRHIYDKFIGVKQSLHFLQEKGNDVESLFEQEWIEIYQHGNDEIISRHINIQYYLQDLLQKVSLRINRYYTEKNLYGVLANKLMTLHKRDPHRKRKFAFISFNQDTILEFFLKSYFRIQIDSLGDYTRMNDVAFSLFKPHGSWNWGWEFPGIPQNRLLTPEWLFQEKANLYRLYYKLLGNYEDMIDWNSYGMESGFHNSGIGKYNVNKSNLKMIFPGNENLYYPSLLLPYRDKDEFTMPASHFWDLNNYLPFVETLIIIGWKGNEKHFNKILQSQGKKIRKLIIADPNPEIVEENLAFLTANGTEIIKYNDFEEFALKGFDKEFR